jgi:hypothetical protein
MRIGLGELTILGLACGIVGFVVGVILYPRMSKWLTRNRGGIHAPWHPRMDRHLMNVGLMLVGGGAYVVYDGLFGDLGSAARSVSVVFGMICMLAGTLDVVVWHPNRLTSY